MRRKNIAVVGMLLVTCLSSVGCGQKKDKQESLAATKTSAFETASEKQTEEKTEKETIKETSKETVKETETETEKETESKTEADTKTAVSESDELADGVYTADFNTDSSMFHVNEACDGKGTLTVKDGEMTIHVSLTSKKILNLYYGLAADAVKEGAQLLDPTTDSVTYSDGMTEEVYGFDIPVPSLDQEFDVALIGTKGTWYDHKVSVSNPEPKEDDAKSTVDLEDGTYTAEVTLEGGSGRATIESPATITVKDGVATASIVWSSPNYDYMIVDGKKLFPVNTEGNSVFEIPVASFDTELDVIADTVAIEANADESASDNKTSMQNVLGEPTGSMALSYAENFSVDYYGDYTLLKTKDGTQILTVPEDKDIPDNLDEDIVVLKQPVDGIYLVSSAVMDMFRELGALDCIQFSGQKAENWYIDEAKEAMEQGKMLYAGKYSSPDYELLVSKKCSLAIENSMILHSPEVKEMLEDFDIPVIIEYSSYETHPLGRVEWIKFFGALTGMEEEAEKAFEKQTEIVKHVTATKKTDKTVAFFYITSNGLVQVRQSNDYIPKMIELAGGRYIFENLGDDSKRSTMNMQVEEFYNKAKDADYLIYNSTIDGGVKSVDELIEKCSVLSDFKAVKSGDVWCTEKDVYQQSMSIGFLIEDIHNMLQGADDKEMNYLYRLD